MRDTLRIGDTDRLRFTVTAEKTVPFIYPECPDIAGMPAVFATGFMVGLMEWACLEALAPHLDEGEGSLGTLIDVTHVAPTLPGMTVTVDVVCDAIRGRQLFWRVTARDDLDLIGEGRHGRTVVRWDRFAAKLDDKRARFAALQG